MVTLKGSHYDDFLFLWNSSVYLADGSTKKDISFGDRVWMWGHLNSQSGGKIQLGNYTKVGTQTNIYSVDQVVVGDYTAIAENVHITDNNNHPVNPEYRKFMRIKGDDESRLWKHSDHKPVIIGENCWIGRDVSILKGVTIGNNSVIASNSVVTKSIPENCIAAGNPAKVVKTDIENIMPPTTCEAFNLYLQNKNKE
ncbi:MAG: acyltransferase [Bacteroidales bacterium]|nr:acyltransferase [Bacteroidales bacterium]